MIMPAQALTASLETLVSPTLIIGAAYAGKSQLAHRCLLAQASTVVLGTADLSEGLLAARVAELRKERPSHWTHSEGRLDLGLQVRELCQQHEQILLDSINQWVANQMLTQLHKYSLDQLTQVIEHEARELASTLKDHRTRNRLVLVSSEVGAGIPPPKPIARTFRELVGRINCQLAAVCATVVQVSVGIPLLLKGEMAPHPMLDRRSPADILEPGKMKL